MAQELIYIKVHVFRAGRCVYSNCPGSEVALRVYIVFKIYRPVRIPSVHVRHGTELLLVSVVEEEEGAQRLAKATGEWTRSRGR